MKINRVYANQQTFRKVIFDDDFNGVVAEKSSESTDKDSRNGLGKTLLIKIINFCLGSGVPDDLKSEMMKDWSFSIDLEVKQTVFEITRHVDEPNNIYIAGPVEELALIPNVDGTNEYSLESYKSALGKSIFGLDAKSLKGKKNAPSFRSLMSYFIRSDSTAFNDPFAYFARQKTWSRQVHNAYLLGLDWELASKMNAMKTKLDALSDANKAIEEGALNDFGGSLGELETEKITLQSKLDEMQAKLTTFRVHEQYYDIQKEADNATKSIHSLLNTVNLNEKVIEKYTKDLTIEDSTDLDVEKLYKEVDVHFPAELLRRIQDVKEFHIKATKNRKEYLKTEADRLKREVEETREQISLLTTQKSEHMQVLSSYGALEEFSLLQNEVNLQKAKVKDVESKITRLTEVADTISRLNVELEDMSRSLRRDYSERLPSLSLAIKLFNENSQYLYEQPGKLSIDTSKSGYKFKVDIKRANSDGVGNMKTFCYDLMNAEVWATVKNRPLPLIHDSKIFDGVDERQVAKALELAYKKSQEFGFQYIFTINSDKIPYDLFKPEFADDFKSKIKVTYTDNGDKGNLLGITF